MSKTLEESKRSIHSTRIDVIAGDPMPIKPLDSLPINTVLRPKVEDPEYKPDTASELAAALSALARLCRPRRCALDLEPVMCFAQRCAFRIAASQRLFM